MTKPSTDLRVALVTGSTSGIGFSIAKRLAAEGHAIVLNGLESARDADAVLEAVHEAGAARVSYIQADLRDPTEIVRMMNRIDPAPGILVNNAGMQRVGPIESASPETWNDMVALNLSAAFHTIRMVLPEMRRQNWGRIVNIASVSGLIAAPMKAPYAATKHGLIGLTKAVALETATTGITCNAVCPGWVLTPLVEQQVAALAEREKLSIEDATARLLEAKQPSRAFVEARDVAAVVGFLCSSSCGQVRGATWAIDGGYLAA